MATHSSVPAWRVPRTEEPGGLQSMTLSLSSLWSPQIDICYFHIQTCSLNFQLNSQLGCLPSTQNLYCYIYYLSPKPTSLVGLSISPTPSVGSIISQLSAKEILESNIYFFFNWFFIYLYNFLMGSSFKTFLSRKALDKVTKDNSNF